LDEDEIVEEVSRLIKEKLLETNTSRVFYTQNASSLNSSKSSINFSSPQIIRIKDQRNEMENFISNKRGSDDSLFTPQKK
jgi:hypothetical protein